MFDNQPNHEIWQISMIMIWFQFTMVILNTYVIADINKTKHISENIMRNFEFIIKLNKLKLIIKVGEV